ncbi:hypothetical protein TSAR_002065 [Trichomalopsis sarcophagae]|uniref:Uncharacterized protein n=1 Tax=Trichomalopsis sarcophagae TaxID=543379 RepID=A0A232EJ96_9HYME|nr:hypothetical protein TSAR_002065 [Trichomalopsis sarcophagae]
MKKKKKSTTKAASSAVAKDIFVNYKTLFLNASIVYLHVDVLNMDRLLLDGVETFKEYFNSILLNPLYSTSDSIGHSLVARLFLIGLASHQIEHSSLSQVWNGSSLSVTRKSIRRKMVAGQKRHHDSQTQGNQTSTTTKHRCHQIIPMVFGLNNS